MSNRKSATPGTIWLGESDEIASSADVGSSCQVYFRNLTDETLILCWVNEQGDPHHFYKLEPCTTHGGFLRGSSPLPKDKEDHVETTVEGHAFLVAAADNVDAVRRQKSLKEATVLGAYRPEKPAAESDREEAVVHFVEVVDPSRSPANRLQNLFTCCLPTKRKVEALLDDDEDEENSSSTPRYTLRARLVKVDDTPMDTTCKRYDSAVLGDCKWPVLLEPGWYGDDPELEQILSSDLDHMSSCLPKHAVTLLRDEKPTPIWVNCTFTCGPKACPKQLHHMCFHPGAGWLESNLMHSEKSECVELYCSADYRRTREHWGVGGLLLHEFSHAYHHKGCEDGYSNKEIKECYDKAMEEGLYDKVRVHGVQGPTAKAYACTNAMEYFAELSAAFLGGTPDRQKERGKDPKKGLEEFNKWYPFHRQQIKEHDPRAYELLKKIWKVEDEE